MLLSSELPANSFRGYRNGEVGERRLGHPEEEEAERFYGEFKQRNVGVRVGMESSGHSRWFERLLQQPGLELWIGDPAEIQGKRVRKLEEMPGSD